MKFVKFFGLLVLTCVLTIGTQIGGVIFMICYLFFRKSRKRVILSFAFFYLCSTLLIVPRIAPYFGREKIKTNDRVQIHTLLTSLSNRDYVVPQVNDVLNRVSSSMRHSYTEFEIHCLDANFPFWDGFPLLPHLSHNDGKKLDISLVYQNKTGKVVNSKPTRSGYGVFEAPLPREYNQIEICKQKGYWQYDFPKYLTLGSTNTELVMSTSATRKMLLEIFNCNAVSKVFIEPHLKSRLNLTHSKLRYHGCQAVRHDDHIHLQVK